MADVEVVELTEEQARELERLVSRVVSMYSDRSGGQVIVNRLRVLQMELEDFDGELRFGLGVGSDVLEEWACLIEVEIDMERRKNENGWGLDGRQLRAAENAVDALKSSERVEVA